MKPIDLSNIWVRFTFLIILVFLYFNIGYIIPRESSTQLILFYLFTLITTYLILNTKNSYSQILIIGIIFRLVFFNSVPILSDDFYRFIWDGNLMLKGINPYKYLPKDIINDGTIFNLANDLFEGMSSLSANNYSNYPPFNQLGFLFSVWTNPGNIITNIMVMRGLIILSDIGTFLIGIKVLNYLKIPIERIGWYFLNPLVIIELTGNLHWEGVMLFFFITGIWMLLKNNMVRSTLFFSISIAIKLIPILILPVLWRYFDNKRKYYFITLIFIFSIFLIAPFINDYNSISNYFKTLSLWFNKFEFNASIYYIVREVGILIKGYNLIKEISQITPFIIIGIVSYYSFFKKNKNPKEFFVNMLLVLSLYFFISTTVHPWYIISLVLLGIFTNYSFPIFWSSMIFISYTTYGNKLFQENLYATALEYIVVYGVFLYEMKYKKPLIKSFSGD